MTMPITVQRLAGNTDDAGTPGRLRSGQSVAAAAPLPVRGIALGGGAGVVRVDVSGDNGMTWLPARLGADEGRYSFRRWDATVSLAGKGEHASMVRCTNTAGVVQPLMPNWNPDGFMQNGIKSTALTAI